MSIYSQQDKQCSEEAKDFSKQWFKKFAKTYPPFQFVINYSEIMKDYDENSPEGIYGKRFAEILRMEADKDINNELRLIELEKDLIPLVENTDNKIFYRHLFFPSIFINNDFNFEGLIVKGIYITECYSEPDSNSYTLHWPVPNDYAIFIVAADIDIGCEFYTCFAMVNKAIGENFTDTSEERARMRRLTEYARTLICNIVDMVEGNDEDLEVVTISTSKEQNLKRIKRRQIPMPTKVFIKAKGEFKKYIKEFNQDSNDDNKKLTHRFLVRGHFRHFRSDKFVYKQGEKTWIKPFYKGEGILISKDYIIQ
jgi:hypothetical protein